jgi:hypothetical protein
MASLSSGGVFLSYRREDAAVYARLLETALRERIPGTYVFLDVDAIAPGVNFAKVIRKAIDSCSVLVVLIGPRWATLTDEQGRRRLDDPGDYVRSEIRMALERGKSQRFAALASIAEALAATDPDRAERIAKSITSATWAGWKATALAAIAEAQGQLAVRYSAALTS